MVPIDIFIVEWYYFSCFKFNLILNSLVLKFEDNLSFFLQTKFSSIFRKISVVRKII